MKLWLTIFVYTLLQVTQCAKILGIFPLHGRSHYILGSTLMRGLAEKGHDVTIISPFGEKDPPKNGSYRDITLTDPTKSDGIGLDLFMVDKMNFVEYGFMLNAFGNMITETTLAHPNVQKLLNSNEQFDIVIVEQFIDDALKAFAYHYNAPLVLFSTCGSNAWINPLVANPAPPSYVAEQNINFDPMKFSDRLKNTIIYVYGVINRHFIFFPAQNKLMKKYFPNAPDLDIINYNASLVLLNSHLSTNMAVPRVPSMIDIGGFHIQPPKKLPSDLQHYLDAATEGVIYFSMGSVLKSTNLPPEKRDGILRVFSKLKQKVLWKWEDDVLPGQPNNVKLRKWFPQAEILAHPNVKVFITHGGLLSLIESVYHGVPVLPIPVYGDQIWNSVEVAANSIGRYILFRDLDEKKLAESLNDLLNNPKYSDNMRRRSIIMRDRRHTPIEDVDYWLQYVIRHQGATHFRVKGLDLPWYKYILLDVMCFIFGVIFFVLYLFLILLNIIVKMCSENVQKNKVKQN